MTTKKTYLLAVMAMVMLLASCWEDDSYQAGFPELSTKSSYYYANNTHDTLYVTGYGAWQITAQESNGWCNFNQTSGKGMISYSIGVNFSENTTGKARYAYFDIFDVAHPDTRCTFVQRQLATRGDGALGNAAMVKAIKGSDGSNITFTYDTYRRPLSLLMQKDGTTLKDLVFTYSDVDGKLTVNSRGVVLTGTYGNSYQPQDLKGNGDTITVAEQSYFNMMTSAYAFNFVESFAMGYQAYGYLMLNTPAHPDSMYVADSLRYQSLDGKTGNIVREYMGLKYSSIDNRCQSVDVNQLLLGVEQCNPYLLLSLCRMARSSRIVSDATFTKNEDNISVLAQLNADKSVQKLIVTRHGASITYEFEY